MENSARFIDRRELEHKITININHKKNLKLIISDTGKGIEVGDTNQIFDLFYVAHDRLNGSGIGLYQARLAAGRLNGTIILSNPRKPTSFEITIPNV